MRLALVLLTLLAAPLQAAWPPPVPSQFVMTVRETAGVARTNEIVRCGVPLPRSLDIRSTASLVVESGGVAVPAQFRILARWNAGRNDASAPIQWLLVTFPATVAANGSATYRLVTDASSGANPAPAIPLQLLQNGNAVTINTGAATFTIGGDATALLDEVQRGGVTYAHAAPMTGRVAATDVAHATTRRVYIEESGPLAAVVVVEGAYDLTPIGGGQLSSRRRYLFTAGSPAAIVRHSVAWEGDLCGNGVIDCNGAPNAIRVERLRDALALDLPLPRTVSIAGAASAAFVNDAAGSGQTASLRQRLRASRTSPRAFEISTPAGSSNGTLADGGVLVSSAAAGSVAIAIAHMDDYEPQALRQLSDGSLAIDIADDFAWLGARQGLFATLAIAALPSSPSRSTVDQQVWAPLNHPLHAWPSAAWFASSDAVDEFPAGALASDLTTFDSHVQNVMTQTIAKRATVGLSGLQTFGLYPRYWGSVLYGDEVDCTDSTPSESWDNLYWCATWTDYHNTVASSVMWAMRSGESEWLDSISFPGALRMLHTQIMQCGPADSYFYCGQAPAGYGGYRFDFNSSHAYFDNLMLYYWLTGDSTVVETLQRGASSMRSYLCTKRPASPCSPTDPQTDEWSGFIGRVAIQWFSVFRFAGLTSDDASYLEDYASGLARAVSQNVALVDQQGTRYGFYAPAAITTASAYSSDQLWMTSLYDANLLFRLQRDTNDALLGSPLVAPSSVRIAFARSLAQFASSVAAGGDSTAAGVWPNTMQFTFAGSRVGGTLSSVVAETGGSDPTLYDSGKATLTAAIVRSADDTGDAALRTLGHDLVTHSLAAAQYESSPLGKIQGVYLSRLPSAVARLSLVSGPARRGDANGDGSVTADDVFYLINTLFASGPAPIGSGDANSDGSLDVADLFFLINYLFATGPPPAPWSSAPSQW